MSVVAAAACPICASVRCEPLLERRGVPVWQNAVYPDVETSRAAVLGDLDFQRCTACGFVWNAAFEAGRLDYAPAYENRQSLSPAFQAHLRARAKACLALVEGIARPQPASSRSAVARAISWRSWPKPRARAAGSA